MRTKRERNMLVDLMVTKVNLAKQYNTNEVVNKLYSQKAAANVRSQSKANGNRVTNFEFQLY